jgi:predicted ATPase
MDERKVLYQEFLNDKKIYNLNVGYWRNKLQNALSEKISSGDQLIKNIDDKGKNFYDGNPIFSYYSPKMDKAIRVIQLDPTYIETYSEIKLIEAWITKIFVAKKNALENEVPELVISLFLTKSTVDSCTQLAKEWFFGDLTQLNLHNRLGENAEKSDENFNKTKARKTDLYTDMDVTELHRKLTIARLKYKPEIIKYLLIAEAPPDNLVRFFYYEDVHKHDQLFLGVAQVLYPDLKEEFLSSGRDKEIKKQILQKFSDDGFYLLDFSELPLSLHSKPLKSQLSKLITKLSSEINVDTKIILISTSVYDLAYSKLYLYGFANIVNVRIPFPGQSWQNKFNLEFKRALDLAGYYESPK